MATETEIPVQIYTEMTPNPETMKFVTNKILFNGQSADFPEIEMTKESALASELFGFPFVKGVFIMNNFITITRNGEMDWYEIIPTLKEFIKNYIEAGKEIISKNYKAVTHASQQDEHVIVEKIKEVLDNYVKPAVEMDGGAIQFKSYENGKVNLMLQGSCSGCPSSIITLKSGIEGLLKRMVPEVEEVVAESV
jgi:NFU1 iron-sulfur cluster scaffold homolog, mitochondrial